MIISIGVKLLERGRFLMGIARLFDSMRLSFLIVVCIDSILEFVDPCKRVPSSTVLRRFYSIFIKHRHGRRIQRILIALGDPPDKPR